MPPPNRNKKSIPKWNPITLNDLLMIPRSPTIEGPPAIPDSTSQPVQNLPLAAGALEPQSPDSAPPQPVPPRKPAPTATFTTVPPHPAPLHVPKSTLTATSAKITLAGGSNLGNLLLFPPDFMRLLLKFQTTTNSIDQMDWVEQLEEGWAEARAKTAHAVLSILECKACTARDKALEKPRVAMGSEAIEVLVAGGELSDVKVNREKIHVSSLPRDIAPGENLLEQSGTESQIPKAVWDVLEDVGKEIDSVELHLLDERKVKAICEGLGRVERVFWAEHFKVCCELKGDSRVAGQRR